MAYKGSDLSQDFKSFYRKEKNRITKILTNLGCTNIQLDYGFYYFYGFFTSKSGQIYYLSCSDIRHFGGYNKNNLLYRTAKHYKDWTGGCNQYISPSDLENIRLI
jgi:hypothetical protein